MRCIEMAKEQLERWLLEKGSGEDQRLARKMHVLADCLFHAAAYGQLDAGSVVCLEVVARRLQAIVDADSVSAAKPKWSIADITAVRRAR